MWLDARECHRCRRKHADDQKAQNDIIGKVHNVVPATPKVVCTRAINVTEQRDRTPLPAAMVLTRNGAIPPLGNRAARSLVTSFEVTCER
jgi:hypothetical protein